MFDFMNSIPSRKVIERLKEKYKPGMTVILDHMEDKQAPMIGTKGTVIGVDDVGSIMVNWENGSMLNVVYGIDRCHIIS